MSDFFKDWNRGSGFGDSRNFLETKRTVVVKHVDGTISEHTGITDPWRYIKAVKKNLDVENAWIKD
jgi:hypothetical protein